MTKEDRFYQALVEKDSSFEGSFIVGVKTTGIFCRPTCSARKPKRENVEFFPSTKEAILKGYRACKVCHPMEQAGKAPEYVVQLLARMEEFPEIKIKDYDLRAMGMEPSQVRRWFVKNHGITFHAYQRMYRINHAFSCYQADSHRIVDMAFSSGYDSLSGFNHAFKNVMGVSPQNSKTIQVINLTRLETDLGTMIACATEKGICLLEFTDRKMLETELKQLVKSKRVQIVQGDNRFFKPLKEQLTAYFQGKLSKFDLPLDLIGTEFQKKVWDLLLQVPYGSVSTYSNQAAKLGNARAVRAVANANGMNKIAIVVPCHRIIGSDGSLTGYAGGLWRKRKLLELEQKFLGTDN